MSRGTTIKRRLNSDTVKTEDEVECGDSNSMEDTLHDRDRGAEGQAIINDNFVTQEDTEAIFQKLTMPSLILTKLKVKKSKQGI